MSPEIHEKVQPTKLLDPNLVSRRYKCAQVRWIGTEVTSAIAGWSKGTPYLQTTA